MIGIHIIYSTYGRMAILFCKVPGSVLSGTMTSHSSFGLVKVAIERIDLAIGSNWR
jgi:xanthine/uracil permease